MDGSMFASDSRAQLKVSPGTSAGFWLRGSMPPCRLSRRKFRKLDYEMVRSEVYLNKYAVSIAPFSTPACPDCSQNITCTLEVFLNDMRYINPRFTYLLTYLLT